MNLIGAWIVDPSDSDALAELGDVLLEFDENGGLVYAVRAEDKLQIIKLRYRVEGNELVTDQPSAPRTERTKFTLAGDGVLTLALEGVKSRFVRIDALPE